MNQNNYKIQQAANMELVYGYQDLIRCLGKLIRLTESSNYKEAFTGNDYHESVVHLFLKSIISYIHEAYECMNSGKFYATNMLLRAVYENYFLLSAIDQYPNHNLAELWQLNSVLKSLDNLKLDEKQKNRKLFEYSLILNLDIDQIEWKKLKRPYGWLYPILKEGKDNLYAICELLGEEYLYIYNNDYRILCEFVHGNSLFQKTGTFSFDVSVFSMITRISDLLVRTIWTWFDVDESLEKQYEKLARMLEIADARNK